MAHLHSNNRNSRICVSAQNSSFRGDQALLYPQFTFVFYVIQKKVFRGPITRLRTVSHTRHEFEHPIPSVESESNSIQLISRMLSNMSIPFRLQNMFWSLDDEARTDSNPSPLQSHVDIKSKILEFARQIIRDRRGYYKLRMTVTIEKTMVVSDPQLAGYPDHAPLPSNNSSSISIPRRILRRLQTADIDDQLSEQIMHRAMNIAAFRPHPAIDDTLESVMDETTEVVGSNPVTDNDLFERIPDEAMETAVFKSNPAAEWAVEALEKLVYDGSCGGGASRLRCPVCMEEVMIGSHLTRMPCSHMFHKDCILEWLMRSHTCPLCRFQLPIDDM